MSWNCGLQVSNRENAELSEIIFSVFFPSVLPFHPEKRPEGSVRFWGWNGGRKIASRNYSVSSSSLPASQPLLYIRRRLGNCMKSWQHWVLLSAICCLEFGLRPATTLLSCHYLHHYIFRELSRHSCSYNSDDGLCSTITSSSSSHAWLMWFRFSNEQNNVPFIQTLYIGIFL